MTPTALPSSEPGRSSAFLVYVLYILSIPSFAIFALIGVIIALASRDGAGPFARSHLDNQVRVWMTAFWWAVGLAVLGVVGALLTVVLIGFVILWIACLLGLGVMIWFTVKSALGLMALLDNRAR